jgi:hypothetical protein
VDHDADSFVGDGDFDEADTAILAPSQFVSGDRTHGGGDVRLAAFKSLKAASGTRPANHKVNGWASCLELERHLFADREERTGTIDKHRPADRQAARLKEDCCDESQQEQRPEAELEAAAR